MEMKMKILIPILLLIFFGGLLVFLFYRDPIQKLGRSLVTTDIKAAIIELDRSIWRLEQNKIGQSGDVRKVYFYDESVGYAIAFPNIVLKTSDGGVHWETLSVLSDYAIEDIFFTNSTEGFCITNKLTNEYDGENESHILKSTDGGRTWVSGYMSDSGAFRRLVFGSDGTGFVVGKARLTAPQVDSADLIIHTTDNGQTWTDISTHLNNIAVNESGRVQESLTDVFILGNRDIVVLSSSGKLYKSVDNGKSWAAVSVLSNEPSQTDINHFGVFEDGRFWIAGGTDSQEGIWGMISVSKDYVGWNRYRLNGYYFSDAKFISASEIVACGSVPFITSSGREQRKGVILYSNDNGKSWMKVEENSSSTEFTSIAKLTSNRVFVAGQNGVGVLLEKHLK